MDLDDRRDASADESGGERSGRRGFMRLAAGVATGAALAAVAEQGTAQAATGDNMKVGQLNTPSDNADVTEIESASFTDLMPTTFQVKNYTVNTAFANPTQRVAILGVSSDVDASSGHRVGVFGASAPFGDPDLRGVGVLGTSNLTVQSPEPAEPVGVLGVAGQGGTGVQGTGDVYGVVGSSSATGGVGVRALSNSGIGIVATGSGNAINATSVGTGVGISATGVNGVVGTANNTGDGVSGVSTSGRGMLATSTSGDGVRGVSASGRAVVARSTSNIAVSAESQTGLDLDCNGTGRVRVKPQAATGAPTAGTFAAGELILDSAGDLYACLVTGTPGTWHKVGSSVATTPTGLFRAVDPFRAYDSREAAYPVNGTLATGTNRLVPVKDAHSSTGAVTAADVVPVGATAVTFNLTVVSPTAAAGFLAIAPGSAAETAVSTVNWTAPGTVVANGGTVKIDADRQVRVFAGGLTGAAHIIVDISGYYV